MKIHFCDLCNESVPQADLDTGRAFLRKGRVVCAACDRAMSHHDPNEPHSADPGLDPSQRTVIWPSAQGAAPGATPLGTPSYPSSPFDTGPLDSGPLGAGPSNFGEPPPVFASMQPMHSTPHPHAHPAPARPAKSSGGLWVGLLGLAFTAGAILVLDDRIKGIETRSQEMSSTLEERTRQVVSLQRRGEAAEEDLKKLERNTALRVDAEKMRREEIGTELVRLRRENSEMAEKLVALQATTAALEQKSGSGDVDVAKRMDELSARLAKGEDDARILAEKMSMLESAAPAVTVADPAKAEPAVPEVAWHAHVPGLKSDNSSTRWEAVTTLGATKDPETVPHITPMLKDPDIFVRMAAARVLGDMQAKGGVSALIDALEDVETAVREAANIALRTITGKDFKFDPLAIEAERGRRVKAWRDWWKKEGETPSGS